MNGGEIIGLIGPNGSGKTTFFNLLTGIYKPTAGQITYRAEDLVGLPAFKISQKGIARTFQNNRLFLNLSVLDNVLIGMHSHQDSNLVRCDFQTEICGEGDKKRRGRGKFFKITQIRFLSTKKALVGEYAPNFFE
jgi:ABC-type branched-subunit amino acid transport system ATPase component